ncbi:addiction module antitoxin RelB [Pandoraea iniqua]|uniref:Addiction module antitoxin RelB n=1 Tax=Pandoraea iniqua TaxID=2508288 RepID=A0A5E4Y3J0_9BURK|nr:type II toxin-antitoxin system RelE/ParE family toxin [Pandoraea iniqua]VVE37355.1 addiction module antitoxin RelB [Pandoraea iniqua]VVE43241.1 addiction module antitoxin RelB [Pandoraea iniqua]
MTKMLQHPEFSKWFSGLRDSKGIATIAQRLDRLALGNPPVGVGVSELRVDIGPGYRVYFVQRGAVLVVLLCGGDKSTQAKDIKHAKKLADELED